jgi:hypothetical protein
MPSRGPAISMRRISQMVCSRLRHLPLIASIAYEDVDQRRRQEGSEILDADNSGPAQGQ